MSDERGQALILAVFVIALAGVIIGGLRVAQDRVLASHTERRAYEAAVEAAASVVADAVTGGRDARDALVLERARLAAVDLARRNGGGPIERLTVTCDDRWTEVTLGAAGDTFRAAVEIACSHR